MTLPEPKSPYTMTLPEVPESRIRIHLTTLKSSGNKCTQRAGICVPREESTYAPSIRKMISPPRQFTAKAERVVERSTQCKSKHEASRNTKQVKRKGQSKWKNETKASANNDMKASGKMRRSKGSRPRPGKRQAKSKTSEIQRRRLLKDASVNKDHQKSTGSS